MRKKILMLGLCLIVALFTVPSDGVHAESREHKVVRVGWYDSPFHSMDQFGRRSGYGYEYQQRIATYTGWKYEYVEGSWPELFAMLQAGEIDLLSDVSYTPERAEKILYSDEPMGDEAYHAFVATDNTEIRPDDITSLNGKRVGVDKNSIQEQIFIQWAADREIDVDIVELVVGASEELELLGNGGIDVLVTLDSYESIGGMVPVFRIGSSDFYFGINKERPDLKEDLDAAMNRLLEDDHDLHRRLNEKYNKAVAVNSYLTFEEKKWLDDHGTIVVGYRDDFLPYCDSSGTDGALTGALADFLLYAETCEKNARLEFKTRSFSTTEEAMQALAAGEIDCVFPVSMSYYDGEQMEVIVTDPFISTEMFAIVNAGDRQGVSADMDMTVAVVRGHLNHETFLKDHFPGWEIRFYDTVEDCFKAVNRGDTDCTLVSNYRINTISKLYSKYRLSALATGADMDLSFAIRESDDQLFSIISKVNRLIPFSMKNSSLTAYSFPDEKVTFLDFLMDNMAMAMAVFFTVVTVILLLALRSYRAEAKARERREIISEAEMDPLTGLYNRNFFIVYTNRYYKDHPDVPMDAIVLNIERFHTLNTLNGREFGDDVLRELGSEIRSFVLETGDIAGRVGSDHFDIFCRHRDDYDKILERFQTVMDAFSDSADIRLRMGVAPWQEGVDPERLFARAWSACSEARGDYKSKYSVYDDELRQREEHSQRLQNDLGRALDKNELEIYYQPKYYIQSDPPKLNSAEALVRWNHPELGMVSPGEFIPLFEKSGQISDLDRYVWEGAARQVASWRESFGIELPVSVNLSRVDVFDPDLDKVLDGIITQYGLSRSTLKLEVTESAYTDNADELIRVIENLRKKGYEVEMDDFGSGYSSLNMLSSMPVDILKMDMAFIRNIEQNKKDLRLVELIVDISGYLKVPVVAEGVENENQLRLLKDVGCDIVQGYYFSRPLPASGFEENVLAKQIQRAGG